MLQPENDRPGPPPASDEAVELEPVLEITNEFASVLVRRVKTRNGVRLRISSPRTESSIDLDALSLESLTWQRAETFSKLLSRPFKPADAE